MWMPSRLLGKPVVAGQAIQPKLQHDLGGARRPAPLALDVCQAFQKTADVEQQPGTASPAKALAETDSQNTLTQADTAPVWRGTQPQRQAEAKRPQ